MTSEAHPNERLERLDQAPLMRDRIYGQLENLITTGVFKPGTRIVESDIADRLGVSRGPIREALQQLARDGFVDLRPRQGTFVHVPTPKEIDDFFDVRRALEAESARLAALRVTPESAKRLTEALRRGLTLLEQGSDPSANPHEATLHEEVALLADNPILAQMLDNVRRRSIWYLSPFDLKRRHETWNEHQLVVDAIISGDAERATRATIVHIEGAREHYKSLAPTES